MRLPLLPLAAVARRVTADFLRDTDRPEVRQTRFLQTLLRVQQDTALGRDLGLDRVESVEDFRDRLPVEPYAFYEPYLERVARGEARVLTADPVVYLNFTSGSTGKKKAIAVTRRSRRALARANNASSCFALAAVQRRGQPLGRMLLTSSARVLGRTEGGIEYGPVSVGHLRSSSPLARQLMVHPFPVLEIADSLARHYVCLYFALRDRDLGAIGANFPVLALRLADYLETHGESLVEDVARGTLADWLAIAPELRDRLARHLRPAPARAAELRALLDRDGRLLPYRAWPNLAFLVTARGGTSDFYFQRFPDYFGQTPTFGGTYASAEATFGVYPELDEDGAILALDSGFFEFVPADAWDDENPRTLLPHEVRQGERYRILVTNYSGFYRYDIGDVVEVTGFWNRTPRIVFRHRRGGLLSSTTEKTTEFHAVQTLNVLQREFGVTLENFCITLSDDEIPPHYRVNIELAPGSRLDRPEAFVARFDEVLKDLHASYEVKRRDQVPPPRLRILAPGSFARVRQRAIAQGTPESHFKFPHIHEDRQFLAGATVLREVCASGDCAAIA